MRKLGACPSRAATGRRKPADFTVLILAPLFAPTPAAAKRCGEFFTAQINNDHTRRAYLIQRRAAAAGIRTRIGNHGFRATGITAYLKNHGTLEHAQTIANQASPRTTKLYDRRGDEISVDEVEKIAV